MDIAPNGTPMDTPIDRTQELQTALRLLQFLKARLKNLEIDTMSLRAIAQQLENEIGDSTPSGAEEATLDLALKDVIGSG